MHDFQDALLDHGLDEKFSLKRLRALHSPFFVPKLDDKPQNPIIRSIQRIGDHGPQLPPELVLLSDTITHGQETLENTCDENQAEDIWIRAGFGGPSYKSHIASWDTLRKSYPDPPNPSPFITEQAPHIVAAARHHAYPRFLVPNEHLVYLSKEELFECLTTVLLGCSSALQYWERTSERFVSRSADGKKVRLVLDGMDDVVCESYIKRYNIIGTLLRRLENLVENLRRNSTTSANSTSYAFAHALSSVLTWLRSRIAKISSNANLTGVQRLSAFWHSLQETESILHSIAYLCMRDINKDPAEYTPLPASYHELLSHIYDFLTLHIQRQAPRIIISLLAYILTVTSRPYFQTISQSIGFDHLVDILDNARKLAQKRRDNALNELLEGNGEAVTDELDFDTEAEAAEEYPVFISNEIREAILQAKRSIRILSAPELVDSEPLSVPQPRKLEWFWTEQDITAIVLDGTPQLDSPHIPALATDITTAITDEGIKHKYKPELAGFAIFDLEPCSPSQRSSTHLPDTQTLPNFLAKFPPSPPSQAPTLTILTSIVLSSVMKQATFLNQAALQIFMNPSSSLHLRAHLALLRSYMLITADAFKRRLTSALFAESDEYDSDPANFVARVRNRTMRGHENIRHPRANDTNYMRNRICVVGLAYGLTDRDEWPPRDSDFSFYLSSVVQDSLEYVRAANNTKKRMDISIDAMNEKGKNVIQLGNDEFWNEAESRIGFAIRDLPASENKENWKNPTSIEALDFLYMEYKPPGPLRHLITPEILSKYRRVFTFLLRLLRIESAMRLLYRLTRPSASILLFSSNRLANSTFLHFRFAAQSFLTVLLSYVYDTAIGGNVDAFIALVASAESASSPYSFTPNHSPFPNVLSLTTRHARVMDDVLAACLLRGAQHAVRDILHACLVTILDFAVLIGDVCGSGMEASKGVEVRELEVNKWEQEKVVKMESLFTRFQAKRDLLVKALKRVTDRNTTTTRSDYPSSVNSTITNGRDKQQHLPIPPGGMDALVNLIARLSELGSTV